HSRSSVHKRVAYLNVLPFPPRRSSDLDPDRIGEYAHAFHRDTLAATANVPALEHFARSLSMVFAKVPAPEGAPPDSYTIDHSATDRKSTRLNSSHVKISYAVFCRKTTR